MPSPKISSDTPKKRPVYGAAKEGKGRPKGAINKTTRSVKEALAEAFERIGGVDSLAEWGSREPAEFYKLWAKILPLQINSEITSANNTVPTINLTITRDDGA